MDERQRNPIWINTKQAAALIGTSIGSTQKAMKLLNEKMSAKGYFTVSGYVNRAAFLRFVGDGAESGQKFEL